MSPYIQALKKMLSPQNVMGSYYFKYSINIPSKIFPEMLGYSS